MRGNAVRPFVFAFVLCVAPAIPAAFPASQKGGSSAIVLVFKDGHRQTFNLADIERVEFTGSAPSAAESASVPNAGPPRGHYIGKWEVGDGNGSNFIITLKESGDAQRSLGNVHGTWAYVNGEARVSWDDGAQDAIRKVEGQYQKFAYGRGKPSPVIPTT